jgi:hypothetical protein
MSLEILVFLHMHKVLHIYRQQEEGKTLDHKVWTGGKASESWWRPWWAHGRDGAPLMWAGLCLRRGQPSCVHRLLLPNTNSY